MAQSPARLSEGLLDRAGDNAALPATAQYGVGDSHSEDRGGIAHMSRVWSCNEWDQLEEVILGNPLNARFPTADRSSQLAEFSNRSLAEIPRGPFPQRIIEETEEDLNEFARTLQGLGISVKRPDACARPLRAHRGWQYLHHCRNPPRRHRSPRLRPQPLHIVLASL